MKTALEALCRQLDQVLAEAPDARPLDVDASEHGDQPGQVAIVTMSTGHMIAVNVEDYPEPCKRKRMLAQIEFVIMLAALLHCEAADLSVEVRGAARAQ